MLFLNVVVKSSKRFVKLLSASVSDTRGLSSVHVVPFFELGFFVIAMSMIGCFADEFADDTPQVHSSHASTCVFFRY